MWGPGSPVGSVKGSTSKLNSRRCILKGWLILWNLITYQNSSCAVLCQKALKHVINCSANPVVANSFLIYKHHAISVRRVTIIFAPNTLRVFFFVCYLSPRKAIAAIWCYRAPWLLHHVISVVVWGSVQCVAFRNMFSTVLRCIDKLLGGYRVSIRPLPLKGLSTATWTAAFSSEAAAAPWTWARSTGVCVHQSPSSHAHTFEIHNLCDFCM